MLELAEDELSNFYKVWISVFVSVTYCYIVGKIIPKGLTRLIAILPIIALFLALPLKLTSFHFCGMTAFFIAWLANFKLLLFAFGKGPLSSNPSISFPHFLALSCLPIKIQQDLVRKNPTDSSDGLNPDTKSRVIKSHPHHKNSPKSKINQNKHHNSPSDLDPPPQKPAWNYIIKVLLLAIVIKIYDYSDHIHPKIIWLNYFFHMYFILELVLALLAASAKLFLGFELEPQFNEPFLSTSLQDFWGRRWNIMVTKILRPTIYLPTLNFFTKVLGRMLAQLLAVMSTFLVSAVMHELVVYYLGRVTPTLELTWFFLLHGFSLCVEVFIKKSSIGRKCSVPWWVSTPITVGFVSGTGMWLFLPPLVRAGLDTKPFQEYEAVAKFLRTMKTTLISD